MPSTAYPDVVPIPGGWERPWELKVASEEINGIVCAEWARMNGFIRYLQQRNSTMARNSIRTHGDGVKMAQSGGVAKGTPARPKDPGTHRTKGDGLKTAWANQTAKPSKLVPMDAAKKKFR